MNVWLYNGSLHAPPFIHLLQRALRRQGLEAPIVGFDDRKEPVTGNVISLGRTATGMAFAAGALARMARSGRLQACLKLREEGSRLASLKRIALWTAVRAHRPDILHLQWASHLSYFTWLFEEPARPRIVLSLRGRLIHSAPIADLNLRSLYRTFFPQVDAFHAVSQAMAEAALKYGASADKISVIYSAAEATLQQPVPQPGSEPLRLLSVGRHHWIKGYRYALEAVALLRDRGLPVRYTIIAGGDPEETRFHIRELDIEPHVRLLPALPQAEVFVHMRNSDGLLLPSLGEGLANVALEAMAQGCLMLSADVGGMPELIRDGWNGLLFPARDVEQLAAKIMQVWHMPPAARQQLIRRAQQTLWKRHRPDELGRRMIRLYQEILCV